MIGFKFSMLIAVTFAAAIAQASPAEVLIIRHGEKPAGQLNSADTDDAEGTGLRDLSPKGYERANALPRLFMQDARFLSHGTPVAIYAGSPKHADTGSLRPLETIVPTAKALGLTPITKFISKDDQDMVDAVMKNKAYDGKTVLISWPHDQIEDMTHAFGVKNKRIPQWKGKTFDRVWKIDFDEDGNADGFEDCPQHLLPGDSAN